MRIARIRPAIALGAVALAWAPAGAQEAKRAEYRDRQELEAAYHKQAVELDRRKLEDLAALAGRLSGDAAEDCYRAALDLAAAKNLYDEAGPVARAYLARGGGRPQTHALAAAVGLIARANRGELAESLADLESFLRQRAGERLSEADRLSPGLALAVGEAYLQSLLRGRRYDVAKKACKLAAAGHPDPAVKAHFEARHARLELVGRPAPPIRGVDADGKPVSLSDLKGKVVLVDFWTTWCPSCVASFPALRELSREYKGRGLAVLGVNLDGLAAGEGGKPASGPDEALSAVRWFLVAQRASWPSLVGKGAEEAARAYGVEEVPANFLIGPDGTVAHVEVEPHALPKAVAELLAGGTRR